MKIAIIADSHFSERNRFEDCIRVHNWISDECDSRGVVLTLHAGDVFDSKSTPREREAVAKWLQLQSKLGPVIIARGNHDALGDLKLFEKLDAENPIIVEEEAKVHRLVIRGEMVEVAAVAWPRKASLLASGTTDVHLAMRNLISGLASQCISDNRVLLIHAMVQGSITSTGQPLVGCDMEVSIEDLVPAVVAHGFNFIALGHIHKSQEWSVVRGRDCTKLVYPGSPRPTNFGETEDKGFLICDTNDDVYELVKTPTTPMIHVDIEWRDGHFMATNSVECINGAEVRLRYTVQSDQRDAASIAVSKFVDDLMKIGSKSVKVEEVVKATTRARMPEVAAAKTLTDKLEVYWQMETLSEERKRRLLDLAVRLEEEVG